MKIPYLLVTCPQNLGVNQQSEERRRKVGFFFNALKPRGVARKQPKIHIFLFFFIQSTPGQQIIR